MMDVAFLFHALHKNMAGIGEMEDTEGELILGEDGVEEVGEGGGHSWVICRNRFFSFWTRRGFSPLMSWRCERSAERSKRA